MTLVYSAPHIFVLLCFHIQNFFNMLKFIYYLLSKLIIELRDKYIILLLLYTNIYFLSHLMYNVIRLRV